MVRDNGVRMKVTYSPYKRPFMAHCKNTHRRNTVVLSPPNVLVYPLQTLGQWWGTNSDQSVQMWPRENHDDVVAARHG